MNPAHNLVKWIYFISFNLFMCGTFAQQSKIDSLLNLLKTSKEDTTKVNYLNAFSWEMLNQGEYEKAMQYASDAIILCGKLLPIINFQSSIINSKKATAYNNIGLIHANKGDYEKALEFYFKALSIREELGDKKAMAVSYQNIGNVHTNKSNFDKALEFYFKALALREELGDKKGMADSYITIGLIQWHKGNNDKALEFYFKALSIYEKLGDKNRMALAYNNIGNIYSNKGDHDKALEFFFKSLKIKEEIGDKKGMTHSCNNIGAIHYDKGNYDMALEFYFKALKTREEMQDKNGMAMSYTNIGLVFIKQKKFGEAKEQLNKGLKLSKQIGSKDLIKESYNDLSQLSSMQSNWKDAYQYHKLYSEIKDSIFNEESNKQITEMQTKYETEKKEQQIKLLNKDKEIQTKDLERQKTIRNAVAGGLMLVLLFSFVLINRLLLIRKQKKVIEIEREKSEKLLLNILPKDTAEELKQHNKVTPKKYEMVTVMFTDFKGFTTIAEKMSAEELVSELDFIFKKFDEIISKYPIEKIKTIGDAYMCAGGLPVANTTNPIDVVNAALEIQQWMKAQNKWQLRLGIHTGSIIAGVVGDKKFAYDIWGDTVNTASRMESSGEAGKVNISGTTYKLVKNEFNCIYRGEIEAKNKGKIKMYFVGTT